MRDLPVYSNFNSDLPITHEEIHIVHAALGSEFQALFSEEE